MSDGVTFEASMKQAVTTLAAAAVQHSSTRGDLLTFMLASLGVTATTWTFYCSISPDLVNKTRSLLGPEIDKLRQLVASASPEVAFDVLYNNAGGLE